MMGETGRKKEEMYCVLSLERPMTKKKKVIAFYLICVCYFVASLSFHVSFYLFICLAKNNKTSEK